MIRLKKGDVLKKYLLLLTILLLAAILIACGEDPVKTDDDDPGSPYSGTFWVENELVSNDCVVPSPPFGLINVIVEGDSIWFATFPGVWAADTLTGTGDTPEYTMPVDPPECYAYYTVVYEITYVTADSFSGTYGAHYRKDPGCLNPDPCSFMYNITGSR